MHVLGRERWIRQEPLEEPREDEAQRNGKMQRPGVCNALECLLVHRSAAAGLLPRVEALVAEGLEIRGDAETVAIAKSARAAKDEDWGFEFLAKILAVRVVGSMDEAMEHIRVHSIDRFGLKPRRELKRSRFLWER